MSSLADLYYRSQLRTISILTWQGYVSYGGCIKCIVAVVPGRFVTTNFWQPETEWIVV